VSPIRERFALLKQKGEGALVPFITAGDPSLDALGEVMGALEEGGADLIEVGIPFSDPIADGPSIQASSHRSLERGATPKAVLDALKGARATVPVVLMGYYNPILQLGLAKFAEAALAAGVSGTIVSDLPPEEAGNWLAASRAAGLDTIFLAAPTSTDSRLDAVCGASSGFVYAVSRTGVTGAEPGIQVEAEQLAKRIKSRTDLPVCVGFGISSAEQVRSVCGFADGAIIGSHLVQLLAQEWREGKGRDSLVRRVRELKSATQG
jgi:tryptophan synthase alpha chain